MGCFRCTLVGQPVRLAALHQALTNCSFPFPGDDTSGSDVEFSQLGSPLTVRDEANPFNRSTSFSLLTLKPKRVSKVTRKTSIPSNSLRQGRECEVIPALSATNDGGQNQLGDSTLSTSDGGRLATPARVRVLLADDDAAQRNSLLQILVGEGFEVDAVGDGSEALSRTARVAYDAVLMDGFMPVQVISFRSTASSAKIVFVLV
jgi:hypothetical protein